MDDVVDDWDERRINQPELGRWINQPELGRWINQPELGSR